MTVFYLAVALLIIVALIFVIPPLLQRRPGGRAIGRSTINISIYRNQLAELEQDLQNDTISRDQYDQGRLELEQRLLEDVPEQSTDAGDGSVRPARRTAVAAVLFIPLFVVSAYLYFGNPAAIDPQSAPVVTPDMPKAEISDRINMMVERLAQRLKEKPEDGDGWAMLGRSYIALQRYGDALTALKQAVRLKKNDAQLLADYADAMAMAGGKSLAGEPGRLIRRALKIDPTNQKALWLAGTAAYEQADFRTALGYWQRLYKLVPKDSQAARTMETNISEAQALLAGRKPAASTDAVAAEARADTGQTQGLDKIQGTVQLAPALRARVRAEDTVFIFARAARGPRMPLAIIRARAGDLPLSYTLDDSKAIDPTMRLSRFARVEVVARVSRSGDATPRSGDLQGSSGIVTAGHDVAVLIDKVLP